jgi:hypothetical protein
VVTKSDLVQVAAKASNLSKAAAGDAVNAVFDAIVENVAKGKRVTVVGFGTFLPRKLMAVMSNKACFAIGDQQSNDAILDVDGVYEIATDLGAKDLGAKNGAVVDRLFDVARRLSGIGQDAVAEVNRDSENDQNDSSTSD